MYVRLVTAALFSVLFCLQGMAQEESTGEEVVADDAKNTSYAFGYNLGKSFASVSDDVDTDAFWAAFQEGFSGAEATIDEQEMAQLIQKFQMKLIEAPGKNFLAENATKEGVVVLDSGLQYKVISEGSGASPTAADTVLAHYTGTFIDGTTFDSSVERGQPAKFPLSGVIPGWTEGLQLMKEGSKYELYIPYNLAYGPQGRQGAIPPFATLIFEVELITVNPAS